MYDGFWQYESFACKFTGYERDSESGLDNAQARYNSSAMGRFMSPDPIGNFVADATNPQTWNLYAYVNNNPLIFTDPTGTDGCEWSAASICIAEEGSLFQVNWEQDFGFGTYYTMDGVAVPPAVAQSTLSNFDAAAGCPDNNCGALTVNRINGQWYEEFTIPCPPGSVAACTGTGVLPLPNYSMWQQQQPQPPIWWLQTKVFVSTLGNNLVNEFKNGDCVNTFLNAAAEGGILPDSPPGAGPDDAVRQGGVAVAGAYAVTQGLTVPLRSSIYRGILDASEGAATGLVAIDLFAKTTEGAIAEGKAMWNGTCH